jgi:glycopeptide antibiotics resistance protein
MRLLYKCLLTLYVVALGFRVFTPRVDYVKATSQFTFGDQGRVRNIFYYEGNFQWLGNFLMLMPLVLLIVLLYPRMKSLNILVMSLFVSTFIETIQFYIPGRISDWKDVLINSLGAAFILKSARKIQSVSSDFS